MAFDGRVLEIVICCVRWLRLGSAATLGIWLGLEFGGRRSWLRVPLSYTGPVWSIVSGLYGGWASTALAFGAADAETLSGTDDPAEIGNRLVTAFAADIGLSATELC